MSAQDPSLAFLFSRIPLHWPPLEATLPMCLTRIFLFACVVAKRIFNVCKHCSYHSACTSPTTSPSEQKPSMAVSVRLLPTRPPALQWQRAPVEDPIWGLLLCLCPWYPPSPTEQLGSCPRGPSRVRIQTDFRMGADSNLPPSRATGSSGFPESLPLCSACPLSFPSRHRPSLSVICAQAFLSHGTHSVLATRGRLILVF